ncbi:Cytidine deaminase [Vibrio cholerae]|nr:Cytidine deaminase [Vibrio cholerae]
MRNRIEQALQQMPASFAPYLRELVLAKDFDATFSAEQYQQLLTLSGLEDADLRVALLPIAAAYSYAPSLNFMSVRLYVASPAASILAPIWNLLVRSLGKPYMLSSAPLAMRG